MKIKVGKTSRGFAIATFEDYYKAKCSLQSSSIATVSCIWLGIDDAEPKVHEQGAGWKPYPLPDDVLLNTRMHLTQEQVKALLPYLHHFVGTGEVGAPEGDAWKREVALALLREAGVTPALVDEVREMLP